DLHPAMLRLRKRERVRDRRRGVKRHGHAQQCEDDDGALRHAGDASTGKHPVRVAPASTNQAERLAEGLSMIACRYGQTLSAMARAPSAFGCARSCCIMRGLPRRSRRMKGTSGTLYFAASSPYRLWNAI